MIRDKTLDHSEDNIERIRKLFRLLLILNLSIIIVCMLLYGEKFDFRNDAVSYLGSVKTSSGYANTASMLLFISGLIACSITCIKLGNSFKYLHDDVPHAGVKYSFNHIPEQKEQNYHVTA